MRMGILSERPDNGGVILFDEPKQILIEKRNKTEDNRSINHVFGKSLIILYF